MFDAKDFEKFSDLLENNKKIHSLSLKNISHDLTYNMDYENFNTILKIIEGNDSLTYLDLSDNKVSKSEQQRFEEALHKRPTLKCLKPEFITMGKKELTLYYNYPTEQKN